MVGFGLDMGVFLACSMGPILHFALDFLHQLIEPSDIRELF